MLLAIAALMSVESMFICLHVSFCAINHLLYCWLNWFWYWAANHFTSFIFKRGKCHLKTCWLTFGLWYTSVKISCSTTYNSLSRTWHVSNDSKLNCNYSLCRHEPTIKSANRFLCFHATVVVITLPACVKIVYLPGSRRALPASLG